jgi:ABC-type polysaccharide/polyol phosphate transport system ATPase subunit
MVHVRVKNLDVKIPIYDANAQRLIRLPTFGLAKVGSRSISHAGGAVAIHALNDVSLDLNEGDRVCLIGHNGAGKTTLLRVLARIYPASAGTIEITGKVIALLGNSIALNSDATGYENIRLLADLYNWPKKSLPEYIKDIEEFTELGAYLSLPARVYSAGMHARLCFSIATMRSADILLIDEGIGNVDAQFQEKAHKRVEQFVSQAKIMVLASHSIELCRAMCNKALLLSNGRQIYFGDMDEAFDRYAHGSS